MQSTTRTHDNHKLHPRRLRWAAPNPRPEDEKLILNDADFTGIFEPIDRHGPLPGSILFAFDPRKNYRNISGRLKRLYHGDDKGSYLYKPKGQYLGIFADSQYLVYDLKPRALRALLARGTQASHPPTGSAHFLHQLMQACVGASFEIGAKEKGLRYVARSEVLEDPRCGASKGTKSPMAIPLGGNKTLIPDDLFALEVSDGRRRHFIVEIDRDTESMAPRDIDRNILGFKTTYFGKKLEHYITALKANTIRSWWGISKPHILIVTTSPGRVQRILAHLKSLKEPAYEGMFYVTYEPTFGDEWKVPKGPLSHLLDDPWRTVAGPVDITQP